MSILIAIFGLALLVMIHEAGHFFAARAVGMTPRKFYLGFGPPLVRTRRGGVEYGIGSIPLGGYVKIPGMNRPSAGDLAALLAEPARHEHRAELGRLDAAIESGDDAAARAALEELRPALGETRGWQELEGALAPDAYWRQATWRRLVAIGAGPAVNLLFAIVLFTILFVVATTRDTNVIGRVLPKTPAAAAGVKVGDRIVSVGGETMKPGRFRRTSARPRDASSRSWSGATAGSSRSRSGRGSTRAPTGSGSRSSRAQARGSPCPPRPETRSR